LSEKFSSKVEEKVMQPKVEIMNTANIDKPIPLDNSQTRIKTFFFSMEDTKIVEKMENAVWMWLSNKNPKVLSTSQSMMVKDGKFHIVLTVFYQDGEPVPVEVQRFDSKKVISEVYKLIRSKPHMHKTSYAEMEKNVSTAFKDLPKNALIVDMGSQDVNGSYKPLIEGKWKYLGIDLGAGLNVDHQMKSEFDTGLPDEYADGLICGQVLEHCRNPFLLVKEMFRIVKKGGMLLITAPAVWPEHKYPFDCFRYYPDGMIALMDFVGGHTFKSYLVESDCFDMETATGVKKLQGMDCWWVGEKGGIK
jgi:hypothetical protein